jgi:hypothetical protein
MRIFFTFNTNAAGGARLSRGRAIRTFATITLKACTVLVVIELALIVRNAHDTLTLVLYGSLVSGASLVCAARILNANSSHAFDPEGAAEQTLTLFHNRDRARVTIVSS